MVGYLFVNASQGVGDEIVVTPIFFSIHAGFRAFQGRFFKIAPPWMSNPQKGKNSKKTASLFLLGKRFSHFLDTGREMIFDGPSRRARIFFCIAET